MLDQYRAARREIYMMKQTLAHYVDQLHMAIELLRERRPVQARLALVLVDNVVELLVHRMATYASMFGENSIHPYLKPIRELERGQFRALRGQDFDRKVNALTDMGKVDKDFCRFAIVAHRYRNEAYHRGITRDDIVWALTWVYIGLACDFGSKGHGISGSSSADDYGDVAAGYFKMVGTTPGCLDVSAPVLALVKANRPIFLGGLAQVLSESIVRRLDELEGQIDFVTENHWNKLEPEQVVVVAQYDAHLRRNGPNYYQFGDEAKAREAMRAFVAEVDQNWEPKHMRSPVPMWRGTARKIASARDDVDALARYQQLDDQMQPFEEAIVDLGSAVDAYMNDDD